jgi:ATP-dependent Zn protease
MTLGGALIEDVYQDWNQYQNSCSNHIYQPNKNKQVHKPSNHFGIEGFQNPTTQAANFPRGPKPQSNKNNIRYGAPSEYLNNIHNNQVESPQLNSPENEPELKEENKPKEPKITSSEIQEMKQLIKNLTDKVYELSSQNKQNQANNETNSNKVNMYDLLLFIIFGLFFIFVLEGFAKLIGKVALKRGKF